MSILKWTRISMSTIRRVHSLHAPLVVQHRLLGSIPLLRLLVCTPQGMRHSDAMGPSLWPLSRHSLSSRLVES